MTGNPLNPVTKGGSLRLRVLRTGEALREGLRLVEISFTAAIDTTCYKSQFGTSCVA